MIEKDFVEKALETAIPEVIESLKTQLVASLDYKITEAAKEQITEYVTGWIKETLIPCIGDRLVKLSESFENQAEEFCDQLAKTFFTAVTERINGRLKDQYNRGKIFDALLG